MLIQQIADLLPEVAKLTKQGQEAIAEDIYAELIDAKFRRKIENGEPMPALEQALREAQENENRGDSVSMDSHADNRQGYMKQGYATLKILKKRGDSQCF